MSGRICLTYPKSMWFSALFFLFMGLGAVPCVLLPPASQPFPPSLLLFVFCILQFHTYNAVSLLAALLFHRIEADDSGVCWQTPTGRRFAAWGDVTDYYEKRPSARTSILKSNQKRENPSQNELWVETTQGRFLVGPFLKGDLEAFRGQVCEKTVCRRTSEWELFGTRPCDTWPRVFDYQAPLRRVAAWAAGIGTAAYFPIAGTLLWRLCRHYYASLEAAEIRSLYVMCWIVAIWPAVMLACSCFSRIDALRHAKEQVTVSPEGFTFRGTNGETITGEWSSVFDYYDVRSSGFFGTRSVVTLKGGDEASWFFTKQIGEYPDLKHIVKKYAPMPQTRLSEGIWPVKSDEHSILSSTGRVYQYQNRLVRTILIGASIIFALLPLSRLFDSLLSISLHPSRNDDVSGFLSVCLILAVPLTYGWWRYFMAGVETDDFWITQRTAFGRRRILWLAVSDYKIIDGNCCVYGKGKRPITIWPTITQFEELKAEVVRRSPSPITGWEQASTDKRPSSES